MKQILFVLLALGLIQSSSAFAQDDGSGRRHGRNREEGGLNNSNPSRGERSGSAEKRAENRVERAVKQEERAEQANEKKQLREEVKRQRSSRHPEQDARQLINSDNSNDMSNRESRPEKEGRQNSNRGENRSNRHSGHENLSGVGTDSTKRLVPQDNVGRHGRASNSDIATEHKNTQVPARIRQMGVTRLPEPIRDRSKLLRDDRKHSVMLPPKEGPGGKAFEGKMFTSRSMSGSSVRNHMTTITKNSAFIAQVNVYNRSEMKKNNYYWHSGNGFNYCHYYDNWNYHWYGWYMGPRFFWTRYYGDNWWWYDGAYDRWCYWHAGGWWWQDPTRVNVVYVYNNSTYTPVQTSAPLASNDSNQVVYQSNDGSRKVKVMGDAKDAFLYDATNTPDFDPLYLASGVKDVKFSDTSNNKPLQIMLSLNDGTFQMFDSYGNGYNKTKRNLSD